MTSVTCGRSRTFDTPVGGFSYQMIPMAAFRAGMDRIELADGRSFLVAIPEKSLADRLVAERGGGIASQKDLYEYLTENLRIDQTTLSRLNSVRIAEFARLYRSRRVQLLAELVGRLGK